MDDTSPNRTSDSAGGLASKRILAELLALAKAFSVEVRVEGGDFATSLCRIKGQPVVYINTDEPVNRAAEVIADALSGQDLDSCFILPEVRALLDSSVSPGPAGQADCRFKQ